MDFLLLMCSLVCTRVVYHVYTQFRLRKIRLTPEFRNESSSVTSTTFCIITMTFGETSDEGQTLQPPVIEFMVLTDCLYNMEIVSFGRQNMTCYMEWIGKGLDKKARYMGSIRTCLLQDGTLYGVNKDLFVIRMYVIWGQQELVLQYIKISSSSQTQLYYYVAIRWR
jgi:hypothetical protein